MSVSYAFISYGMGGAALDPAGGEVVLTRKIKALGVNVMSSPYLYSDVQTIANLILESPETAKIIVGGDSLGANNAPWIGQALNGKRKIDYMFGFQPSIWGAHIELTANVTQALCIWNPTWAETFGLGYYQWQRTAGNTTTDLRYIANSDAHPGDSDVAMQNVILGDIKRIVGA
jgi:hypothetical protein